MAHSIDDRLTQGFERIIPNLLALGLAGHNKFDIDVLPNEIHRFVDQLEERAVDHPIIDDDGLFFESPAVDDGLRQKALGLFAKKKNGGPRRSPRFDELQLFKNLLRTLFGANFSSPAFIRFQKKDEKRVRCRRLSSSD